MILNEIHLGILKWKEKCTCVYLCFRFQLGNSFGKMEMERKSTNVFIFN